MSISDAPKRESPTLPLPPPIALSDLIETATVAVGRAMDARALNPQPLPPSSESPFLSQHRIIIGIIFDPQTLPQLAATPVNQ